MTVAVPSSHRTARELLLKSARERMDIIAAYREVGTFRGAAEITGTTHKTVRRVIAHLPRPTLMLIGYASTPGT